MNCDQVQRVLDAHLDDELDPDTQASVGRHLAGCPSCSALLETRVILSRELRQLPRYPAPAALRQALRRGLVAEEPAARVAHVPRGLMARFKRAGPVGWLAAGVVAGYALALLVPVAPPPQGDLREPLLVRHVASFEAGRPRTEVVSADGHVVKPWFAGKIDFAPMVRELSPQGFELLGGRLDTLEGRPAAVLVYRVRRHHLSLFVARSRDTERAASVSTLRGFSVATWARDGLDYSAVADLDAAEMRRFAELMLPPVR